MCHNVLDFMKVTYLFTMESGVKNGTALIKSCASERDCSTIGVIINMTRIL